MLDDGRIQLAPEWDAIDVSPLSEIGFTRTHVVQLARHGKLSAAEVQDAIHFFSFDLKRNGKGRELKGPPLNFLMGILRKGLPYSPPENYESPADEARRKYREGLARQAERRAADEREIQALEFDGWRRGLSADELAAILPEFARKPGHVQESTLRGHFEQVVWPARQPAGMPLPINERVAVRREIEESLSGMEMPK